MKNYGDIWKRKPRHELAEFQKGQLVKMDPGAHTNKPYYVLITYVNPFPRLQNDVVMTTEIPFHHNLNLILGNNFGYHWRRMTIIGPLTSENRHLLYEQIIE